MVEPLDSSLQATATQTFDPSGSGATARDCAADSQGGLLVTGSLGNGTAEALFIGRLTSDDSPDEQFATNGFARYVFRQADSAIEHIAGAINGDSNARFVVAGSYNSDGNADVSRDVATAMAFAYDALTSTDGGGGGGGGGDGGSFFGGGGSSTGLGLLALLILAGLRCRLGRMDGAGHLRVM